MSKKQIRNVVIYTRVSTEEQTEGFSLEAQREDLIKYCKTYNYNIIGEYEDAGISGTTIKDRKQFKLMLKEIGKGGIDAIIAWKLSRVSRNMIDLVEILDYLQTHDAGLITITDKIDTFTPAGKTFCYLAGIFAEMERDNIVEQSKNGMRQRAKNGLTNGGKPPYGYINNKDGKGLIIDEKAAEIIKTIFDLYTNKNYGYSRICKTLNSDSDTYPTKQGKGWSYQSVQQVLDNPTYAGYIRWGLHSNWAKKRRKATTDEYVLAKGQHKAIIDEDLWQRTQIRRKQQKEKHKTEKLENIHYLLSALARCPECNAAMTTQRSCRKRKSDGEKFWYRYYGCSQWANKKAICHPNLVKADLLEQRVIKRIKDFVQNPKLPELLAKRIGKNTDIQEIEKQIKGIDKKISKLNADENKYYAFLVDEERLKILKEEKILENIGRINKEIELLKEERESLSLQYENAKDLSLDIDKITLLLKNFDTVFENAPFEQQKALLHSLIKEIKIRPSDNINERLEEAVILRFTDLDLTNYETDENEKPFEVTYDTAHPSLS